MVSNWEAELLIEFCLLLLQELLRLDLPRSERNPNENVSHVGEVTDTLDVDHYFAPSIAVSLVHFQHVNRLNFSELGYLILDCL
jgi:hypothetical protein